METAADTQLQIRLDDNNYDETQLISLKAPVTHLSYYQNSSEFESVNGKIEIGGVQYKYVKRRIYHDSLEVLCIPDQMAMQLKSVKNDFFLFANGLRHAGQEKKQSANTGISKETVPDYYPTQYNISLKTAVYFIFCKRHTDDVSPLFSFYAPAPERPPQG